MRKQKIKIGDIFTTNNYGACVVLEYVNHKKVKVKFITTGYETYCAANTLRKGVVKDLYYPSTYGVGYLGRGDYSSSINGEHTKEYAIWASMLERCYSVKNKYYHRYGGRGITVCKEWHNFQNFASWVVGQPNFGKKGFQLDKDLRIKDSKEYSSETCSFVPQNINSLLVSRNKSRGEYSVGVYLDKVRNKFTSQCSNVEGKTVTLGRYQTPEEAFQAYKTYKENLIKQVALEEFNKGNITEEVYNNLLNWEVVPFPE